MSKANSRKDEPQKPPPPLQPLDEKQLYSIEETIRYLRTSRRTLYQLLATQRLRSFTVGTRRYVSGSELVRFSQGPAS